MRIVFVLFALFFMSTQAIAGQSYTLKIYHNDILTQEHKGFKYLQECVYKGQDLQNMDIFLNPKSTMFFKCVKG